MSSNLSHEVAAALEAWRKFRRDFPDFDQGNDKSTLADAMPSLYPPGHADEIKPERLKACGFVADGHEMVCGCVRYIVPGHSWWITKESDESGRWYRAEIVPVCLRPRNMGEVWELLDRLGIDWRKKGGEA